MGVAPRPQGKGVPSDSTTCHPSNNPFPPLQAPLFSLPSPLPSTHSSPQPLARSFARLLASPLPGLQFCTNLSSRCLAHSTFAPACQPSQLCFPCTHCISFPTLHAPFSPTRACTLPLAPSLTHLTSENFWALAADTLGTRFSLTNSHALCTRIYSLEYPSLCSTLAHSLSCASLLRCLHFL